MKKRTIFKTTSLLTRAETMKIDAIVADLDSDFNIKKNDPFCPYMVKVIGEREFHLSELDYISIKLKEHRDRLLHLLQTKENASLQIKTGDNVYSIIIVH